MQPKKITALATTTKGKAAFKIENKDQFFSLLEKMGGNIVITVEKVADNSEKQQWRLQQSIDWFVDYQRSNGDPITEAVARQWLLGQIVGLTDPLTKEECSVAIEGVEEFIRELKRQ